MSRCQRGTEDGIALDLIGRRLRFTDPSRGRRSGPLPFRVGPAKCSRPLGCRSLSMAELESAVGPSTNDGGLLWPSALSRASSRLERVTRDLHTFPIPRKHKARVLPVERRVCPVCRTVVIRTDEHQIVQLIIAAAAQPVHVVRFTELPSVHRPRVPSTKLAHACVQLSQLFDMSRVAPSCLVEQIAAALICNAGRLGCDETAYSTLIAEEDTGLQLLLRQEMSPRLERQAPSALRKHLVVCQSQPPDGCVTLK